MRPYCRYFYSFCFSIVLPLWCHFCFYKVGLVPANCLPKMSVCIHTSYYVCICFYFQTKKKFHSIERVGVDKLQPKLMFLVLYFHFIFYFNTYRVSSSADRIGLSSPLPIDEPLDINLGSIARSWSCLFI